MAQYGVVPQLLALVQWRARSHACVTTAVIVLRQSLSDSKCPARTPDCPGQDSWVLTDWLWPWLKLAITRWPTWAVLEKLWLQAHCQCGASPWTWLCEVSSCRGNLSSSCQPTHYSRQYPLQQVHVRDQVCCRSAGYPSPVRWRRRGRRRLSSWPVASPTSTSSLRRWRDIREIGDIIGLWYQIILISEALITQYHRRNRMISTIDIR